ncbi:unnamed protein product [Candida parapsilosis]|nr:unnamed protein product [Candida parapsilosis]
MFGGDNKQQRDAHKTLPSINSFAAGKSPLLPALLRNNETRSASFDTGSTAVAATGSGAKSAFPPTTLPPISHSNKRRLIDDPSNFTNRRHSSAHAMLMQAHVNGSRSNLAHGFYNNSPKHAPVHAQSGNVSPSSYHGSPLMSGSLGSRNNSVTHFELLNNNNYPHGQNHHHQHNNGDNISSMRGITSSPNSTTNSLSSRRSSSIVSDMAPHSSIGSKFGADYYNSNNNGNTHRRNLSQNSSFNSPLLTPSTRFSISSTTSLMNHQLTTTTSSPVHKSHDYYSKNRSGSVLVTGNINALQEEEHKRERRSVGDRSGDGSSNDNDDDDVQMSDGKRRSIDDNDATPKLSNDQHANAHETTKSPGSETRKMSVAALLD